MTPKVAFGLLTTFTLLAFLLGLLEVGGNVGHLPNWFYAYAPMVGVVATLGHRVQRADHSRRPRWQRLLLLGFGSTLPLAALISVMEVLDGTLSTPAQQVSFIGIWATVALISGLLVLWLERRAKQGSQRAKTLREWF